MSLVIIIGLTVAVASLWWLATNQDRKIKNYEKELLTKAKRGSNAKR